VHSPGEAVQEGTDVTSPRCSVPGACHSSVLRLATASRPGSSQANRAEAGKWHRRRPADCPSQRDRRIRSLRSAPAEHRLGSTAPLSASLVDSPSGSTMFAPTGSTITSRSQSRPPLSVGGLESVPPFHLSPRRFDGAARTNRGLRYATQSSAGLGVLAQFLRSCPGRRRTTSRISRNRRRQFQFRHCVARSSLR
jgi:hypothetical protein